MVDSDVETKFLACSRNACREEAVVTVSCNYMARRVSLVDLAPSAEPDHFHLCAEHMSRFRPPLGWETEDLRTPQQTSLAQTERATA